MKKGLKIGGIILIILIIGFIIYATSIDKYLYYSAKIEIKIPLTAKMEIKDTHGGFLGDGETFMKVHLTDNQAERIVFEIQLNEHWKETPLPGTLSELITNSIDRDMNIPNVQNGYWFFLDRHSDAIDRYRYDDIHARSSLNCTVAVYDVDTNTIYYYAIDT